MEVKVCKLTTELLDDRLYFFDNASLEHNGNAAHHGPAGLYEKNGFTVCNNIGGCLVVRKNCNPICKPIIVGIE